MKWLLLFEISAGPDLLPVWVTSNYGIRFRSSSTLMGRAHLLRSRLMAKKNEEAYRSLLAIKRAIEGGNAIVISPQFGEERMLIHKPKEEGDGD